MLCLHSDYIVVDKTCAHATSVRTQLMFLLTCIIFFINSAIKWRFRSDKTKCSLFRFSEALSRAGLELVSRQAAASCEYILLRAQAVLPADSVVVDVTDDSAFTWVDELRSALHRAESEDVRVYAVSRAGSCGALGLATCLRAEPGGSALRVYYLPDSKVPFARHAPAFAAQLRKDLAVNVLRAGVWGSYRHLELVRNDAQLQVCSVRHLPLIIYLFCWLYQSTIITL